MSSSLPNLVSVILVLASTTLTKGKRSECVMLREWERKSQLTTMAFPTYLEIARSYTCNVRTQYKAATTFLRHEN